jgi:hypothetical protein
MTMTTAEAMAIMREREPMWREGMTPEEFEEETLDCARQDIRMDKMRADGWRPLCEQPIDQAAKKRAQDAARAKKYRRNKKAQASKRHATVI